MQKNVELKMNSQEASYVYGFLSARVDEWSRVRWQMRKKMPSAAFLESDQIYKTIEKLNSDLRFQIKRAMDAGENPENI